jgi:tetratricopeptide (TPR) repeat protein
MNYLRLFPLILLFWGSAALAQETPPPTDLAERVEAAAAQAEEAANDASTSADLAQQYAEIASQKSDDLIGMANDLLALFQNVTAVAGVIIPLLAVVAGIVGIGRLNSAQQELSESRMKFEQEMEAARARLEKETQEKEAQLNALRDELTRSTSNATLALSYLPLGEGQYKSGDYMGALDIYLRALGLDENNPIIHYRLGYVYTQSGRLEEAEHHLKRALEIDNKFSPAMAVLGYAYRRIGEKMETGIERDKMLNSAERLLQEGLTISPKLVDDDGESWWGSLGGLYRRRGQIDQAIYAYDKAGEVVPNSSYAFSNLALLYMQKGNREKMIETYYKVEKLAFNEVQAEVDNYWAYADLLTARLALGKLAEAEATIEQVFTTAPEDSPYALESLMDTLGRLASVLEAELAAHVRDYIERIRIYVADQAREKESQLAPGD